MGEIELNDEGTEEHIAEEDAHEGGGRGLDAGAVVRVQPPLLEGNLEGEAPNGDLYGQAARLGVQRRIN